MSPEAGLQVRWDASDVLAAGVRLYVRRVVEPAAPPILLLHGLGVSGAVWQPFARRLLPSFAAVAPDLRGHGASDAPASGYAPADYASDLAALAETLFTGPVPVLGQSLGALVALALARLRPEAVSALVLVDPPIDGTRDNPDVENVWRLKHEPPGALEQYLLRVNPGSGKMLARNLAAQFRRTVDAAYQTMLARPRPAPDTWSDLAAIRCPLLLVQADPAAGGLIGDSAAQDVIARAHDAMLVKSDGAALAAHASHPAELARAVLAFLP